MDNLGKVGLIGRFKPLHLGGAALLESVCEKASEVIIGIGSSNKYNERNPFTAKETEDMINSFLSGRFNNYKIIYVPDFAQIPGYENGQKWKSFVLDSFGKLDYFVSGNDFVGRLLEKDYSIIHPADVVPKEKHVKLRATRVRYEMATQADWKSLVPQSVADYIEKNKLDERFRREFGLKTIASILEGNDFNKDESAKQESMHAREL